MKHAYYYITGKTYNVIGIQSQWAIDPDMKMEFKRSLIAIAFLNLYDIGNY